MKNPIPVLTAALSVAVSFNLSAEDWVFPNADGSGDIASEAAWGTIGLPGENRPTFKVDLISAGKNKMTCSKDMTFSGLYFTCWDETRRNLFELNLEKSGNPTITMAGNLSVGKFTNVRMIGGTYDFQELYTFDTSGYNKGGASIELNNGCVWTNTSSSWTAMSYAGGGKNCWKLENASAMYWGGNFFLEYYGLHSDKRLDVLSGSRFVIAGNFIFDEGYDETGVSNHKVFVSGASSEFGVGGDMTVGKSYLNESIAIGDGATANCSGTCIIGNRGSGSGLFVSNAVCAVGTLRVGCAAVSSGNVVRIEDDAELNVTENLDFGVGGANNLLDIDNATVNVGGELYSQRGAVGNEVHFSGAAPKLVVGKSMTAYSQNNQVARFVFNLPEDGYADGVAPLQYVGWYRLQSTMQISVTGIEAMQAKMRESGIRKREIPLVVCTKNVLEGLTDETIAAYNAQLPRGASMRRTNVSGDGGNYFTGITLTVKSNNGLCLIFR